MKRHAKWIVIAALAVPCAAIAATGGNLAFPDVVTASGVKFAAQCDDHAFAKTSDTAKLAQQCNRLLAQWNAEANQQSSNAHRNGPRPQHVARLAPDPQPGLPFDTIAMLREMPLQASWGSR